MNVINLQGEVRNDFGKQASRTIRTEGKVPCVIYGGEQVVHFSVESSELKTLVYTPDFNLVEVSVDGKTYKTLVKDIQFHPVTEIIEHLDLLELVPGKKVKASIPIRFVGDSIGVREGGSLVTVIRKIQVKTTPESLVAELIGDISELNLNHSISIKDINIPEGMEVLQDVNSPVGYIEVPRSLKSLESAAGEEGEEEGGEEGEEGAVEVEGTEEN